MGTAGSDSSWEATPAARAVDEQLGIGRIAFDPHDADALRQVEPQGRGSAALDRARCA